MVEWSCPHVAPTLCSLCEEVDMSIQVSYNNLGLALTQIKYHHLWQYLHRLHELRQTISLALSSSGGHLQLQGRTDRGV